MNADRHRQEVQGIYGLTLCHRKSRQAECEVRLELPVPAVLCELQASA